MKPQPFSIYCQKCPPEPTPVEYLRSHWKQHEWPNVCPHNFGELSYHARQALRRMPRRQTLVMAFWSRPSGPLCNHIMEFSSEIESIDISALTGWFYQHRLDAATVLQVHH